MPKDQTQNFKNENAAEVGPRPRIKYPDDILPDANPYCALPKESVRANTKCLGSNPREDERVG